MSNTALHGLIQQHAQGAFAMAQSLLQCPDDANDVIQDTCFSLMRQTRLPADAHELRLLFFRSVRNKAIDYLRKRKTRRAESFDDYQVPADDKSTPESRREAQAQQQRIEHTLKQLSQEHREMILLKDWHGFAYADIASILGIESGTVMSRLHRARLQFRKLWLASER